MVIQEAFHWGVAQFVLEPIPSLSGRQRNDTLRKGAVWYSGCCPLFFVLRDHYRQVAVIPMPNALFYGDNLAVLREHVADESVDLVYLDPPFNSNASYNVLFREKSGEDSPAQIRAFTDTWEWTQETELTFEHDIIGNPAVPAAVKDMITAFRQFIGRNAMMAYLVMMAPRLVELRRVLKPTGSIYLHCDPTASHYLKALDGCGVWGHRNFKNEVIWQRTRFQSD